MDRMEESDLMHELLDEAMTIPVVNLFLGDVCQAAATGRQIADPSSYLWMAREILADVIMREKRLAASQDAHYALQMLHAAFQRLGVELPR